MQIWSTNSGWYQIFRYQGEQFVNIQNRKVLDVTGGKDVEGQAVIVHSSHNGANQRWKVLYTDKAVVATSGVSKTSGFRINVPFFLVSRLPMKRVAECIGANNMVLRRYVKGRNAQKFFFNEKDKTIRSQQWKNYGLEIQSNGRSNNLRFTSGINSRWW
jgi:hypothetical protein